MTTTDPRFDIDLRSEVRHAPPIFIVGCQRSGTTVVRLMLDSHRNISCGPETRFLADLAKVTTENWTRLSHFGQDKEYWHRSMARFFDSIQSDYAASRGKTRWADKTPRYALSLDFIDQLFPDCPRRPRGARRPRRRRLAQVAVRVHRRRQGGREVAPLRPDGPGGGRAARPPERYHELRYERLVADPEAIDARRCSEFLDEPWDDAVLHHDRLLPRRGRQVRRLPPAARPPGGPPTTNAVYRSRVGTGRRRARPSPCGLLVRLTELRELGYPGTGAPGRVMNPVPAVEDGGHEGRAQVRGLARGGALNLAGTVVSPGQPGSSSSS